MKDSDQDPTTSELSVGNMVAGRYQVQNRLGKGGYSTVYLVSDMAVRPVELLALKILSPAAARDKRQVARFKQEYEVLRRVDHQYVISVHDWVQSGDLLGYTMEYVPGQTLARYMQQCSREGSTIDFSLAAKWLAQIGAGLAEIHQHGIVHRDLKPENVMISENGDVRLFDFGVVRDLAAETLTPDGIMVGTAKYLAPEYIELGDCDHRADVFALGAIGYEMVAGRSPYSDDGRMSTLLKRLKQVVPPLSEIVPATPTEFDRVIRKAMEISLPARYQSANDFVNDILCCCLPSDDLAHHK